MTWETLPAYDLEVMNQEPVPAQPAQQPTFITINIEQRWVKFHYYTQPIDFNEYPHDLQVRTLTTNPTPPLTHNEVGNAVHVVRRGETGATNAQWVDYLANGYTMYDAQNNIIYYVLYQSRIYRYRHTQRDWVLVDL